MFRATDALLVARLKARGYRSESVATRHGAVHVLHARGHGLHVPLVVLHGLGAAGHLYEGVFEPMRPFVRSVLAPDLPGHGRSALPQGGADEFALAVAEAIASRIDEPAVLFGNSLGGSTAIRIAHLRPDIVAGLFLLAPGGAPPAHEEELRRFLARFDLQSHGDALEFVDDLFAEPHPMRHLLAWGTRTKMGLPETRALVARIDRDAFLSPTHLGNLAMPVHLVWGGADRILPPEHLGFFRTHLPAHAALEVVPHYGHTPHIDHPLEVQGRLRRFMERVSRARSEGRSGTTGPSPAVR